MVNHAALLKGINVGGNNMVKMADLKRMFTDLGFESPETLLQSGNVVFGSHGRTANELERFLRAEAVKRLNIDVKFFVRDADSWMEVISQNPFAAEAEADPSHLLVHFTDEAPLAYYVDRVQAAIRGPERIHAGSQHLYVVYPEGIGTSTVGRTPGWANLTSHGTARNWNTVVKMMTLLGG